MRDHAVDLVALQLFMGDPRLLVNVCLGETDLDPATVDTSIRVTHEQFTLFCDTHAVGMDDAEAGTCLFKLDSGCNLGLDLESIDF